MTPILFQAVVVVCALSALCSARPEPPPSSSGYPQHPDDGHLEQHQDADDEASDAYGAPFGGMTEYRARPLQPRYPSPTRMMPASGYGAPGAQGPKRGKPYLPTAGSGRLSGNHHGPQKQQGKSGRRGSSGSGPKFGHSSMTRGQVGGHGSGIPDSAAGHKGFASSMRGAGPSSAYRPNPAAVGLGYSAGLGQGGMYSGHGSANPYAARGAPASHGSHSKQGRDMYGPPAGAGPKQGYPDAFDNNALDHDDDDDMSEDAMYKFEFSVGQDGGQDDQDGDDVPQFGQHEERDGDVTRGSYHVLLPDGRLQRVDYEADEHGFRPTVSFEESGNGHGQGNGSGPY